MGSVVVDASVVLGLLDPADAHHSSATRAVKKVRADGDEIILPASALAEVLVGASRMPAIEPGTLQYGFRMPSY